MHPPKLFLVIKDPGLRDLPQTRTSLLPVLGFEVWGFRV